MLLGIDVGTSRTKAVLVDRGGREVLSATVATPFTSQEGRVEMEVDALQSCLRAVLTDLGPQCRDVVAVGVAGMAESGAPLDAAGQALAPVIAWHDGRGEEAVATLDARFGSDLPLRIGQHVRNVLTVSKLGWLVEQGMTGMVRWLGVPELVLHGLTGDEATEFSLAARSGCYDVGAKAWMPEVPEALGFSVDVFPAVRAAGSVMGRVSPAAAAWSGLPTDAPVTVAGHDHLAGMAGAGVGPHDAANSVGTAETIVARTSTLPDMATALEQRIRMTVHPGGQEWAALFGAARAGLVLETAAAALGQPLRELDRLAADAAPADVGHDLVDALAHGDPASLPGAPPGEIWAGLLHALTSRTVDGYTRLTKVIGPCRRLVVFGGGGASEPWLRAKAAALPVAVVRSPVASAVARGAALYAGVAAGWWPAVDDAPMPPR
jgi:xylulokinase